MFNGREYLLSPAKYLKLNLDFPNLEIYHEVRNLRNRFVSYRSNYLNKGWYSLPIIGKSSSEPYAWDQYEEYSSARDAAFDMKYTDIIKYCPETVKWLENVYPSNSYGRVRFMLLEAGGYIEPHTDTEHSVLGAINIAITNPKNCYWKWSDGDTLEFEPGDVYAMNLSYQHSVINNSDQDRYHLIIHHYDSTKAWKSLMLNALKENNEQGQFCFSSELF